MSSPKYGEVREDGFRYRRKGAWLSPKAWRNMQNRANARQKARRQQDPAFARRLAEAEKKRRRRQAEENPVSFMLKESRRSAARRGVPFDLLETDIVLPERCPVFGIPLSVCSAGTGDGSATVDRIDNRLGYVRGNVVVVSHRANRLKSNATLGEMRALVEFYSRFE